MGSSLGSRRSNRIVMAIYALIAVGWSAWRLFEYGLSSYIRVSVEPVVDTPVVGLYGGELQPGNVVELAFAKSDVQRLMGMIDFFRYSEIVVGLVLLLVGMTFLYRFCDRVIDGRAFGKGATVDLTVVAVVLMLYPFLTGMLRQMGTNSVLGSLELTDVLDTAASFDGVWIAIAVAAFLQFVYAAIQQGTKLVEDTEGLV
jgi:hypothetical protein